jgi:hypothetical protein
MTGEQAYVKLYGLRMLLDQATVARLHPPAGLGYKQRLVVKMHPYQWELLVKYVTGIGRGPAPAPIAADIEINYTPDGQDIKVWGMEVEFDQYMFPRPQLVASLELTA